MKRQMMVFGCITTMMLLFFEQDCFAVNVLTKKEIPLVFSKAAATKRLTGKLVILGAERPGDEWVIHVGDRFGNVQKITTTLGGDIVLSDYFKTGPIPEAKFNWMIARKKALIEGFPADVDFDGIRFDDSQKVYIVTGHNSDGEFRILRTIK